MPFRGIAKMIKRSCKVKNQGFTAFFRLFSMMIFIAKICLL